MIPRLAFVDDVAARGTLVALVGGPYDGYLVLLPHDCWRLANELLMSLLTPAQRQEWEATRRFWVDTPYGRVRLGVLFDLTHRRPGVADRSLCVVPEGYTSLPVEDIWVNLLLVLQTDPERFFRVAQVNRRVRTPSGRQR